MLSPVPMPGKPIRLQQSRPAPLRTCFPTPPVRQPRPRCLCVDPCHSRLAGLSTAAMCWNPHPAPPCARCSRGPPLGCAVPRRAAGRAAQRGALQRGGAGHSRLLRPAHGPLRLVRGPPLLQLPALRASAAACSLPLLAVAAAVVGGRCCASAAICRSAFVRTGLHAAVAAPACPGPSWQLCVAAPSWQVAAGAGVNRSASLLPPMHALPLGLGPSLPQVHVWRAGPVVQALLPAAAPPRAAPAPPLLLVLSWWAAAAALTLLASRCLRLASCAPACIAGGQPHGCGAGPARHGLHGPCRAVL